MYSKGLDFGIFPSTTNPWDKDFGSYSKVSDPCSSLSQYPAALFPSRVGTLSSSQYPARSADKILSSSIVDVPSSNSEFDVREGLAVTFGVGSIASALIGVLTGNLTSLGVLAVTLAGAGAASLMLDSESSLKLETDNGYSLQFDRRI